MSAAPPAKEDFGMLTGGWPGGEVALWQLRAALVEEERERRETDRRRSAEASDGTGREVALPEARDGLALVYVGHGKSGRQPRKAGALGRFILDDPAKYPSKEDLGFFAGATGGFAAGEKGLAQFVRDGELRLRRAGQPGGREASAVAAAGLLAAAGCGGGLLLNGIADLAEGPVKAEIWRAPIDDTTKALMLAAAYALAAAGLSAVGRALYLSLSRRFATDAQGLVAAGGVWVGTFVAARAVLDL